MVLEIAAAFTALDSIREGVRFVREWRGQAVDLSLTVKRVIQGERSVLAFGRITNNADEPVTVTEVNLLLGNLHVERAPLVDLDFGKDPRRESLEVRSHVGLEIYEEGVSDLIDLSILANDLYLEPKRSRTG